MVLSIQICDLWKANLVAGVCVFIIVKVVLAPSNNVYSVVRTVA